MRFSNQTAAAEACTIPPTTQSQVMKTTPGYEVQGMKGSQPPSRSPLHHAGPFDAYYVQWPNQLYLRPNQLDSALTNFPDIY